MSIVNEAGDNLSKSELLALTTAVVVPDKVKFTADVYENYDLPGAKDSGGGKRLLFHEGQEVSSDKIDAMYTASAATFTSITPTHGPAAGNTDFTIKGTGFDGLDGVTFGGTAATGVKVKPGGKEITGKTPAHASGAVAIVLQDASGNVTQASGYTYD